MQRSYDVPLMCGCLYISHVTHHTAMNHTLAGRITIDCEDVATFVNENAPHTQQLTIRYTDIYDCHTHSQTAVII